MSWENEKKNQASTYVVQSSQSMVVAHVCQDMKKKTLTKSPDHKGPYCRAKDWDIE